MVRAFVVGVVLAAACVALQAQVTVEIGAAGGANSWPFNFTSLSGRYQSPYTAAELNLPGGGQLTQIQVRLSGAIPNPAPSYTNMRIRCAHTTLGNINLTTNLDTNFTPPLELCYGPANTVPTFQNIVSANANFSGNYAIFNLTTPFSYNGTSNLLIDYSFDTRVGAGFTVDSIQARSRAYSNGGNYQSATGSHDTAANWRIRLVFDVGPTINTSTNSLNLGAAPLGTPGVPVQYTVSGSSMTDPTTVTAPAGVEISLAQASGYTSTLNFPGVPAFGPTTIYARIADTAPVGPISLVIAHTSPGAPAKNVTVTGNVVSLLASVATLNAGFTTIGVPGAPVSYDLTGDGLVNATSVTVPPGFEVSDSAAGPFAPVLNIVTMPSFVQTVFVRLDGVNVGNYAGDVVNTSGPATVNIPITGDVFPPNNLHAQRIGPGTTVLVDNNSQGGGNGLVLLHFTLSTIQQPWTVADVTFTASGTADEQTGLSFLGLYEDSATGGNGGLFDGPFVDPLATAGPGVNFNGPNGTYNAVLANTAFPALTTRRFFLVCKLAGKAVATETIKAELTGVNGTTAGGGILTGVPTGHPADAFQINAAELTLYLNGPVVYQTVNNNAQGPNADGVVICDFRISPKNDSWTVNSLSFTQSGTMDGQADVNFLGLYVDDGDGVWDGPANDILATSTPGTNFSAPNGVYTAGMSAAAGAFTVNQIKRFFLVAKLSGSAGTGETMKVRVTAMNQNAPTGGAIVGVPTGSSSALVIDQPTLSVNAGPGNPTVVTREKSAAGFSEMIGQLRLSASNSDFTVAGVTLHTSGNGNWLSNLDAASGVQVYRDNGNGTFDAGDILLFSGAGSTPSVVCAFTTNQTVAMNTDLDLWIVLNLLASAGASPYETFVAAVESGADINSLTVGGTIKLGSLAPTSGELRVVDFRVDDFTPTLDLFAGGGSVKIEGSGFALPVVVTIGGVPCTGTAVVDAAGTLISGLSIPAGTGTNLAIVLTTNNLPPKTLTQTFRYSATLAVGTAGPAPSNNGCTAAGGPLAAAALPLLGVVALRRRRK